MPKSRERKPAPSAAAAAKPTKQFAIREDSAVGEIESVARMSTASSEIGRAEVARPMSSRDRLMEVAVDPPHRPLDLDEKSIALSIEFYNLIRTGQCKKAMEFANTVDATALDLSPRTITKAATGKTSPVLAAFLLYEPTDGSEDSTERNELLLSFMLSAGANDLSRPTITRALYWLLWRRDMSCPLNRMNCVLDVMEAAPDRHGITFVDETAIEHLIERAQYSVFTVGGANSIIGRIIRLMIRFAETSPAALQSQVLQCLNSVKTRFYVERLSVERNLVLATRGDLQRMLIEMSPVIEIDGYLKSSYSDEYEQNPWFIESYFDGEHVMTAVQRMAEYRTKRNALIRFLLADALPRELFPIVDAYGARPPAPAK